MCLLVYFVEENKLWENKASQIQHPASFLKKKKKKKKKRTVQNYCNATMKVVTP
jgi:hypothetical protein